MGDQADYSGYAILLTNDSSYWKPSRNLRTVDQEFRLHEGRRIEGNLNWNGASEGTMHKRKEAIKLKNSYHTRWEGYSEINSKKNGKFRYLALRVDTP